MIKGLFHGGLTLALLAGQAFAGSYYLYSPAPVTEQQVQGKKQEEVAVREITVVKGDSLYMISRRNGARGTYYPQILLFNRIANPNLIYPGQVLRIPYLRGRGSAALNKTSAPAEKSARIVEPATESQPAQKSPSPRTDESAASTPVTNATRVNSESAGQKLYAKGVSAYKSGKCRQAIASFDRFLSRYQDSPTAADATLYRADCYLKLGGK